MSKLIPISDTVSVTNDLIIHLLVRAYPDEEERFSVMRETIEEAYDLCAEELDSETFHSKAAFYNLVDTTTYCLYWNKLEEL